MLCPCSESPWIEGIQSGAIAHTLFASVCQAQLRLGANQLLNRTSAARSLYSPAATDDVHRENPMRVVLLMTLCCLSYSARSAVAAEPTPESRTKQVIAAVGGEDKLLKLFRTRETVNVSSDPEKKAPERASVYEPPKHWWTGKNERVKDEKNPQEPATFLVWGWTLGVLTDPASKLELIPDIVESDKPAVGLRVSGTVSPPMDLYFDKVESRLVRIDWRSDIHRFSDWKEHDGVKYPAKCVGYKKASGKPWYFSQITELERLKELPEGFQRR